MVRILWIEDFQGSDYMKTAAELFKGVVPYDAEFDDEQLISTYLAKFNITHIADFVSAIHCLRSVDVVKEFDFIIIDVNLVTRPFEPLTRDQLKIKDELDRYYEEYVQRCREDGEESNGDPEERLRECAGFYIYLELLESNNFITNNIRFYSQHADAPEVFEQLFKKRKMRPPIDLFIKKNDPTEANEKVVEIISNPYFRLRSAVISHCSMLIQQVDPRVKLRLKPHEIKDHLRLVSDALPGIDHNLTNSAKTEKVYHILLMLLLLPWDNSNPRCKCKSKCDRPEKCPYYLYMNTLPKLRNAVMHYSVPNRNTPITVPDLAYIFLLNAYLLMNYEPEYDFSDLLNLIGELVPMESDKLEADYNLLKSRLQNEVSYYNHRKPKTWRQLHPSVKNNYDKNDMVKVVAVIGNLYEKEPDESPPNLMEVLYMIFWEDVVERPEKKDPLRSALQTRLTSPGRLCPKRMTHENAIL